MAQDHTYTFRAGKDGILQIGADIRVQIRWKNGDAKLKVVQKPRYDVALLRELDLDVSQEVSQN